MTKNIILIITVLFIASCQVPLVLNEEQKNADAVYLSLKEEFFLKSNGEQEYTNSSRLLLQTHVSFNRLYGDSHIDYDPMYQKVDVLRAETENSMGKSTVKENAINDILPKAAQKSGYYNRLRTRVVSHMGTEIGGIINFDYKISSSAKYKLGLFENIVIGKEIPLKEYELSIIVPEGEKLSYKLFNSDVKPVIEKLDKSDKYTWKFNNISAIVKEKSSPKHNSEVMRIVFSTMSELDTRKIVNGDIKESDVSDISKRLVNGIETKKSKLFVLKSAVNNNIALNKVSFKEASYRVRKSKRIWDDVNASSIEKTVLLTEMLNSVGFKSKLLFSVPDNLIEYARVNPDVWEGSYVYVDSINDGILINADHSNLYSANLELNSFKLYDPILGYEFNMPKDQNTINGNIQININSRKKIWGEADIQCSGICKHILKEYDKTYIRNQFDYAAKYRQRNDGYTYYLESTVNNIDDNHFTIKLPVLHSGFSSFHIPPLLDFRATPLEIKGVVDEKYTYSLACSNKFRMINRLESIKKENKVGKVVFNVVVEEGK